MLDTLQRLAQWMQPAARYLSVAAVILLLTCLGLLLLTAGGERGDRLLLPAIAGLVWCIFGYVFIQTFESVPAPPGAEIRGWRMLKRRLARAGHWLLAIVFLGATIAALTLTNRIISEVRAQIISM